MAGIFVILLGILENYGMDVLQIALILFLFWKLFVNHLKHMHITLKSTNKDVKEIKKDMGGLQQRVSKVEGRLDEIN